MEHPAGYLDVPDLALGGCSPWAAASPGIPSEERLKLMQAEADPKAALALSGDAMEIGAVAPLEQPWATGTGLWEHRNHGWWSVDVSGSTM